MINIEKYKEKLTKTNFRELEIGWTTISLFEKEDLEGAQEGYSIDSQGNSLGGNEIGDWKDSWLVIGYESLCGDPLFTDVLNLNFPIYTAMQGAGSWNENLVADSFEGFIEAMKIICEAARGRETANLLEKNPFSLKEKQNILGKIKEINPKSDIDFWESLLES